LYYLDLLRQYFHLMIMMQKTIVNHQ
ncbi:IgA-specific serine endopeptidase autotransporter precursor, partial [Haemophilus influenzae]